MPTHFCDFLTSRHSPGLIVVTRSMPIGRAAERLHLIWAASDSWGIRRRAVLAATRVAIRAQAGRGVGGQR